MEKSTWLWVAIGAAVIYFMNSNVQSPAQMQGVLTQLQQSTQAGTNSIALISNPISTSLVAEPIA